MNSRSFTNSLAAKPGLSRQVRLLANCLHFQPSSDLVEATAGELRASQIWSQLVERSFNHLVAPLLFCRAAERGFLEAAPAEIGELLHATYRLNLARNTEIRNQMTEFAAALDQAGIATIVLKGGAILLDDPPPRDCPVMLSDIDVLVPASRFQEALDIATSLGYAGIPVASWHSVALLNPDFAATIDLHLDLGPQRDVLPAEEAIARAEPVPGSPLKQLCPSDRVVHNIYHAQIQNRGHGLAILSLQQLCNLGFLVERHGSRVDWQSVRARFESLGFGRALRSYLYSAENLLGIRTSPMISFGASERAHLKRTMVQLDWPWLYNLVTLPAVLTFDLTADRRRYMHGKGVQAESRATAVAKLGIRALRRHGHAAFAKLADVHRSRFGRR